MDLNEALKNLNHEDSDVVFKAMKTVSRRASKDQDLAEGWLIYLKPNFTALILRSVPMPAGLQV